MREEWLLDSRRIAPIRLVFPVTGLPGNGTHSSHNLGSWHPVAKSVDYIDCDSESIADAFSPDVEHLWSVAEYADTSGNSEKSGVRIPLTPRTFIP